MGVIAVRRAALAIPRDMRPASSRLAFIRRRPWRAALAVAALAIAIAASQPARAAPPAAMPVGPQYDTSHVYVAPEDVVVMHGDDDQVVPIAISSVLSAGLVEGATLKVYPGLPHGMCGTHADLINPDLLAFFRA